MTLLIVSIAIVLGFSALCSLTEAALYAVRLPTVSALAESGSPAGKTLMGFKRNMEQPISAILIFNTAANTGGAALAGAQATQLFGESALLWFSVSLTLAVLFFGEIMPKVAGVAYHRSVAPLVALPLATIIKVIYPLVWFSQQMARVLRRAKLAKVAPEEEVEQLAMLSAREGSILTFESDLVRNVLALDQIRAKDIMTPRPVVFRLPSNVTVKEVAASVSAAPHARIPVYAADDPDDWTGVAMRADVLKALAQDDFDASVATLSKPLGFVPETTPGHLLLNEFIRRRVHLLGVVDEYGSVQGIVTLEDVLESLLGHEIVDETDTVVDMQEVARQRVAQQFLDSEGAETPETPEGPR